VSRVLANEYNLNGHVIVVDTSMEIAGHERSAHDCIGISLRQSSVVPLFAFSWVDQW
jgi:stage III sporulation protein SpoIIIAA